MSRKALEAVQKALDFCRSHTAETQAAIAMAMAEALWATRPPDDTDESIMWVRCYTWRGPNYVIKVTELEQPDRIVRRLWGWITTPNDGTLYVGQQPKYEENVIKLILEAL